jgi:hypothetical protein
MKTLIIIIVLSIMSLASSFNLSCILNSINETNRLLNDIKKELKKRNGDN